MSGRKTRTISEERYEHLNRVAARHSDLVADLPRLFDGVRQQARADLDAAMRGVQQRQRAFERSLDGLSERAAAFERETTRRLAAQQAQMDADRAHLEAAIAEERDIRARQVAALQGEVDEIKEGAQRERGAAQAWLTDATTLLEAIEAHLPHERFAPGALAAVAAELATARTNLQAGFAAGSALTLAQSAFHRLTEIRGRVELLEHQWRQAQTEARERLLTLQALAERSRTRPGVTEDDRELPDVTIDVDALTDGAVAGVARRVAAGLREVADEDTALARLQAVIAEAGTMQDELTRAVRRATVSHLATQARADVADSIVETLRAKGYRRPHEMTYGAGDQRNALFVKLRHPDDSLIVIEVAPGPASSPLGAPGMRVTIHSFDVDTTSAETRDARMDEIEGDLRADGIELDGARQTVQEPDRAVLDFGRLGEPDPGDERAA